MALTFCPECRQAVIGGAVTCRACGFPLSTCCPDCGQPIADRTSTCGSCGFPYESLASLVPTKCRTGSVSKSKWIIGAVLLAVVAATWLGWTFLAGRKQPSAPTSASGAASALARDTPVNEPAGSPAVAADPAQSELQRNIERLRGAPYFFDNVNELPDGHSQSVYVIILRQRKTLDQCVNQATAQAAQHARCLLGGKDGATYADHAYQPIFALTKSEPDCFTGWEWLAEVSFLQGKKADFQKAVGQMVNLGLHQCVKNETWVMLQKAVRRGWLEPFALLVRRNDAEPATGYVEVGSTSNAVEPDTMVAEDSTRGQTDGSAHFTVLARREQLYIGAGKDLLPQGFGVLQNTDGTVYRGEFVNGKYEGRGILTLPDGSTFSGKFRAGDWDGKGLVNIKGGGMIEAQGDAGSTVWKFGPILYKGEMVKGELKRGIMYDTTNKISWQGEFASDQLNGYGLRTFPDGSQLEGLFVSGAPTRQTTFKNKAGTKYFWIKDDDKAHCYWSENDPDHYVTFPFEK